jgi:ABC-type sugar transport system ATPase subunit
MSPELALGIRLEDIYVRKQEGDTEAKIYIMEPLGFEVLIELRIYDTAMRLRAPPTEEIINLKVGDKVFLKLNMSKIHIFDKNRRSNITYLATNSSYD